MRKFFSERTLTVAVLSIATIRHRRRVPQSASSPSISVRQTNTLGIRFEQFLTHTKYCYADQAYQSKLAEFGMICSMSRKGNCWDNAPTESWFNSFKNERYQGTRYATHAEMKAASVEFIDVFYNRKRQHSTLGYKSPIQFLNRWISEQNQEKLAA